jgi:hypothetical protein
MALEMIQVAGPQPPERDEPLGHLFQRLRLEPIQPALRIDSRLYEPGFAKHPQML